VECNIYSRKPASSQRRRNCRLHMHVRRTHGISTDTPYRRMAPAPDSRGPTEGNGVLVHQAADRDDRGHGHVVEGGCAASLRHTKSESCRFRSMVVRTSLR
jgi:hypothetical protein